MNDDVVPWRGIEVGPTTTTIQGGEYAKSNLLLDPNHIGSAFNYLVILHSVVASPRFRPSIVAHARFLLADFLHRCLFFFLFHF